MTWPIKKIGEICTLKTGATPSTSHPEYYDGDIKWLVSGNIHQKEIFNCEKRITKLGTENSNAKILPKNCVLIALNGQGKTRGTVAILRVEAACNQSLVAIIPNDEVLPEFLYYNLNARYSEIRNLTGANDRRGLNMKIIRNLEIPVPPIEEQKKIVEKIEKLFAKVTETNRLRNESSAISAAILPSTLHHIFSSTKWEEISLGEAVEINPSKKEIGQIGLDTDVSFVPMASVSEKTQNIERSEVRKISQVKNGYTYFRENDVLFAKITPCMENGKVAIASNLKNGIGFGSTEFHVLRAQAKVIPKWLFYFLWNPAFRKKAKRHMTGTAGQQRVPADFLRNSKIPLPPRIEQEKIIAHLDSLFMDVRELEKFQSETRSDLSALKESTLNQAFEGNLFPCD